MTIEKAILAGGCFWGMEELIRQFPGVVETRVGYTGGDFANPTYDDMKTGTTNHAEAVEITFDATQLTYRRLLKFFFQIHDPSTLNRQGNDRGTQYRSAIFYLNDEQKNIAQEVIDRVNESGKWPGRVITQLVAAGQFYEAEAFHQKYIMLRPNGYSCHFIRKDWIL